jgi:hypothetical protein
MAFLCGIPVAAAALPGAHSSTVGGNVFLGGNYIEIGIHSLGSFGTSVDKPAGFSGTTGSSKIGLSSDNDGFGEGYDLRIDYFLPGSAEERWSVGYNGDVTASNAGLMSTSGIPITSALTNTSAGDVLSAELTGTLNSKLQIRQQIQFRTDDKYFANRVTLTNVGADSLTSVRYMRSFDPDNTVFRGGSYETSNEVTKTIAADGSAAVVAQTIAAASLAGEPASRYPILFFSKYAGAVASTFGFSNGNPYDANAYSSPRAKNSSIDADQAITIDFDVGTLAPGASVTFTYYTSLDSRDPDIIIEEIEQVASKPAVTTANTALQYSANGLAAAIDSTVSIADSTNTNIRSAQVTLSNFESGEDVLSYTPQAGITTLASGSNILSFTGSALISTYELLLRSVTYRNTADFPVVTSRVATFAVTNPAGGTGSATRSITIIPVNHRPVVDHTLVNQENIAGKAFSYTILQNTFSDPDGDTLTVSVTGLPASLSYHADTRQISGTTTNADDGTHTITVTATDDSGADNAAVSTTFDLTVAHNPPPVLSSLVVTPHASGAVITWITNESGSTRVAYDLTNALTHLTAETDTSPYVLSHRVDVQGLLSCATYRLRAQSRDPEANAGYSSIETFTTKGCVREASVETQTGADFSVSGTGSYTLTASPNESLTLTVPTGATEEDVQFQLKTLDRTAVLSETSTPDSRTVASLLYHLLALPSVDESTEAFTHVLTVSISYSAADIAGLSEADLWIYRWDSDGWHRLDSCSVNTSAKTVTCTTTSFSIFGIFGVRTSTSSNAGTGIATGGGGSHGSRARGGTVLSLIDLKNKVVIIDHLGQDTVAKTDAAGQTHTAAPEEQSSILVPVPKLTLLQKKILARCARLSPAVRKRVRACVTVMGK